MSPCRGRPVSVSLSTCLLADLRDSLCFPFHLFNNNETQVSSQWSISFSSPVIGNIRLVLTALLRPDPVRLTLPIVKLPNVDSSFPTFTKKHQITFEAMVVLVLRLILFGVCVLSPTLSVLFACVSCLINSNISFFTRWFG